MERHGFVGSKARKSRLYNSKARNRRPYLSAVVINPRHKFTAGHGMATAANHPNHDLISSEDVEGTAVYGAPDDTKIGSIDHHMIEKVSGRVTYAVMSFGGRERRTRERYGVKPYREGRSLAAA
jgi:hypothetical protein